MSENCDVAEMWLIKATERAEHNSRDAYSDTDSNLGSLSHLCDCDYV